MSTGEWLAIGAGVAMWAVMIGACMLGKKPGGCPDCHHEDGADSRGRCINVDAYSGWGSDKCTCTDDYHQERSRQPTEAP